MTAALERIMHRQDEVCTTRNIVVLNQDRVARGAEDVGDLLGNLGAGAAPADEKVELLSLRVLRTSGRIVPDKRFAEPITWQVVIVHWRSPRGRIYNRGGRGPPYEPRGVAWVICRGKSHPRCD